MSSSGGCEPNVSLAGMLKSSMKVMSFLPPMGTYTPLVRFSTRDSMMSCTLFDVVCKVKEDFIIHLFSKSVLYDRRQICKVYNGYGLSCNSLISTILEGFLSQIIDSFKLRRQLFYYYGVLRAQSSYDFICYRDHIYSCQTMLMYLLYYLCVLKK